MKKILLISILLSVLILLLTPIIPAIEFQTVTNNYNNIIEEQHNYFSGFINHIQTILEEIGSADQLSSLYSLLSTNSNTPVLSLIKTYTTNETDPYIDSLLDLIVVIIIAIILSRIISHVFDQIYLFLKATGSTIFAIISYIIGIIIQILIFGTNSAITLIQLLFQFILKIGELAIYLLLGIISVILTIIVIIIYGIGLGIVGIWKVIGTIIGMILDILRVIYESFFPITIT
jgi:hypothetical protein